MGGTDSLRTLANKSINTYASAKFVTPLLHAY